MTNTKTKSFVIWHLCFVLILNFVLCHLTLVLGPYCFGEDNAKSGQTVDGFSLVQYEQGGEKRWQLEGKSATVEENKVKIDEVSAVMFGETTNVKLKAKTGEFDKNDQVAHLEDGVVAQTTNGTRLETESLYWDAEKKNVFTEEPVRITKAEFQVDGHGAVCDLERETAKLEKNVTADMASRDINESRLSAEAYTSELKSLKAEAETTTITCDGPLEINYKKDRATFFNNVEVEDTQGKIFSDRLDVYFNKGTSKVKCVIARGNVRIVNGENITYSEKAIYLVDQGRVILPKRPKLVLQSDYGLPK